MPNQRWPILALLAASLPGCTLLTAAPPGVEVAGVELRGAGLLSGALGVTLCVTNPNDAELSFRRVQIAVDVASAPLAEAVSETPARLPPHASVLVPIAVAVTGRNLESQLLSIVRNGALSYSVRGSVQLDGPLGLPLPFSRGGRLDALAGAELFMDASAKSGTQCGGPSARAGQAELRQPSR